VDRPIPPHPNNLGIETKGGTFIPVMDGRSARPCRGQLILTTDHDNQTRVEVHLLRGASDRASENHSVAKFTLTNIPPLPRGVPQIEVSFHIDVNGIVSVSAEDQATGRHQSMTLHPSGGLTQAEVSRLVEETLARETGERGKKGPDSIVRRLDGLVANTLRSVQALEGKLTSEEQQDILHAIEKAQKAKSDGSPDDLKDRLADLERAATVIGQAMLRP